MNVSLGRSSAIFLVTTCTPWLKWDGLRNATESFFD